MGRNLHDHYNERKLHLQTDPFFKPTAVGFQRVYLLFLPVSNQPSATLANKLACPKDRIPGVATSFQWSTANQHIRTSKRGSSPQSYSKCLASDDVGNWSHKLTFGEWNEGWLRMNWYLDMTQETWHRSHVPSIHAKISRYHKRMSLKKWYLAARLQFGETKKCKVDICKRAA